MSLRGLFGCLEGTTALAKRCVSEPRETEEEHRMPARSGRKSPQKSDSRRSATAKASRRPPSKKKWSGAVTRNSDALDLENKVFQKKKPADIARSLKRSAESSSRRKATPYQSAMSMLTFYVNRAGKSLPKRRLRVLEQAKDELRKAFGRE
jgi:Protein of unknown function (DUF3175)